MPEIPLITRLRYSIPMLIVVLLVCAFAANMPCAAQVNSQSQQAARLQQIVTQIQQLRTLAAATIPPHVRAADMASAGGQGLRGTLANKLAALKKAVGNPDTQAALGRGRVSHSIGWYCVNAPDTFSKLATIAQQMNKAANQFADELQKVSPDREDSRDKLIAYANEVATSLNNYVGSAENKELYAEVRDIHKNLPVLWGGIQTSRASKDEAAGDVAKLKADALVLQDEANKLEPLLSDFEAKKSSILQSIAALMPTVTDQTLRNSYESRRQEASSITVTLPKLSASEMRLQRDQFFVEVEKYAKDISAAFDPVEIEARGCPQFNLKEVDGMRIAAGRTISGAFEKIAQAFAARRTLIELRQGELKKTLKLNEDKAKTLEEKIAMINTKLDAISTPSSPGIPQAEKDRRWNDLQYWRTQHNTAQALKITLIKNAADIRKLMKGCEDQAQIIDQKAPAIKSIYFQFQMAGVIQAN